jgi:uncharacterized damage-inducible protein DinB
MTILDRLLGHDAWTTRQLLLRCRELSVEQISRKFDIGDRSLGGTFEHLIACMESHTDLIMGRKTREHFLETKSLRDDETVEGMLTRLTIVAKDFAAFAAKVEREGRADDVCTNPDNGNTRSLGGVIAHIITHSMHHRAQILYIMEQLGVRNVLEGDALGWESQARGWGWADGGSYGGMVGS